MLSQLLVFLSFINLFTYSFFNFVDENHVTLDKLKKEPLTCGFWLTCQILSDIVMIALILFLFGLVSPIFMIIVNNVFEIMIVISNILRIRDFYILTFAYDD